MTTNKEEIRSATEVQREIDRQSMIALIFGLAVASLFAIGLCFFQLIDVNKNLKSIINIENELNKKLEVKNQIVLPMDPIIATNWVYEAPQVVPLCNYDHVSPSKKGK